MLGQVSPAAALRLDGLVNAHDDSRRPQHPARLSIECERADNAHGRDGRSEIPRHAKDAIAKWTDTPRDCPAAFWEHDQTDASIQGRASQAPHPFQIGSPVHLRYRYVADALHQTAVYRDAQVRLKLEAAYTLRNKPI